ncbi:MFS transporter [Stackebrandtia soli]|uniref:MFS transporter n=1 Tax=Stackebrandtia soli TaxID=1892856 RepID=UPI0039EB9100
MPQQTIPKFPTRPVGRDPNVLRWLGAYTTSVTGDVVFYMSLSWAVVHSAGPAALGAILAVGAVPRAVLMLAGGVLADRVGPRRLVLFSDAARCLAILVGAGWFLITETLWPLLAMSLVFGLADAVFMPAVGALPPRMTDTEQLTRVQALRSLSVRISNAVGPLLGAVVLAVLGPPGAFGLVGLLFIVSIPLIASLRLRPLVSSTVRSGTPVWRDFIDGLTYLRGARPLFRLVLVIGLGELVFSGPLATGLVLLTDERDWGPAVLGMAMAAFSAGGIASGLVLTTIKRTGRPGLTLTVSLAASAVLVMALTVVTTPAMAIAVLAVLGGTTAMSMVIGTAELQARTEPRYLGRITSVTTLFTIGLSPLLLPAAGLITAAWGTGVFFTACAVVCLTAAVIARRVTSDTVLTTKESS